MSRQSSRRAIKRPMTPPSSADSGINKRRCLITVSSSSGNDAVDLLDELPSIQEILNTPQSNRSQFGESSFATPATFRNVRNTHGALSETSNNKQQYSTTPWISCSQEAHSGLEDKRLQPVEGTAPSIRVRSQRARPQLKSFTARAPINPKLASPRRNKALYPEISETDSEISSYPPRRHNEAGQDKSLSLANGHRFITSPKQFHGLSNEGQLCYRNALLQVLFGIPEFANVLDDFEHRNECGSDHCLICQLNGVRRAVHGLDRRHVSKLIVLFTKECFERGWASGRGGRSQEQDAVDFLEWLLGQLLRDILWVCVCGI